MNAFRIYSLTSPKKALQALFQRDVPENSKQLRELWERENMLDQILKMDVVRDWAGLEPGVITVTDDCIEGEGALRIPVDIGPGKHLRIENNFAAGHHDGFRNMMCMGIEVENFARYRTIRFSYKTALRGEHVLLFRIYDRTGGWIDWTIPHPETAAEWTAAILAVPPDVDRLVDIRRIGGVMFELRAPHGAVKGTVYLDNIELLDRCMEGVDANMHLLPDMSYAANPPSLDIPDAYPGRTCRIHTQHVAAGTAHVGERPRCHHALSPRRTPAFQRYSAPRALHQPRYAKTRS